MGKDKLRRFEAIKSYPNVFEPLIGNPFYLKENWNREYFHNQNPIVLELGCGKGEYTLGLAEHFPSCNFIGIDIKGSRMYVGATDALKASRTNVAFLRTKIDFIADCFGNNEIDEIWLTFSDPQPKKPNKRLSSPPFIERYKTILKKTGIIHLKTDSDLLFEYTLEEINNHGYQLLFSTQNLYTEIDQVENSSMQEILKIQTHYEKLFSRKGNTIKYLKFKIT